MTKSARKLTGLIALLIYCSVPKAMGQVRIIKSDPSSALLSFKMQNFEMLIDAQGFAKPYFKGCDYGGQPGEPLIPFHAVLMAVPPASHVSLSIVSSRYNDYQAIDLQPVPVFEPASETGLVRPVFKKSAPLYQRAGFIPTMLAEVVDVGNLRQYYVARIKFNPVHYDPTKNLARVYDEIILRVSWDRPATPVPVLPDPAFEKILSQQIINYEQAQNWALRPSLKASTADDQFSQVRVWYKLLLARDGIYSIDYGYLKRNGIDADIIDPRTIKLYSGYDRAFPRSHTLPQPDSMKQISIIVEGEQDGSFDPGDRIYFFGQGLSGWEKNSSLANSLFHNPYSDTNCYWLSWGGQPGLRMKSRECTPVASDYIVPESFSDTIHFEQDVFNPFNSGELWYWLNLKRMANEVYSGQASEIFVPNPATAQATAKIDLRAGSLGNHHIKWGLNGVLNGDLVWYGGPLSGAITDTATVSITSQLSHSLDLQLNQVSADAIDNVYFNWVEIYYRRKYQAWNYALRFRADSLAGRPYRYKLTGFASESLKVFDISDPCLPISIKSRAFNISQAEFEDYWKSGRIYWAAAPRAWLQPLRVEPYVPQDLRHNYLDVDYLIVSADEFWPQAQALINIHSNSGRFHKPRAVRLSQIYNEFGYGVRDPAAIRNFLRYIYLNSGRVNPGWCLLLGDGSYDYRQIDNTWGKHNFIPTYQETSLVEELGEYLFRCYDDWFAFLDNATSPQIILGRLPCRTIQEAGTVLDKIGSYGTAGTAGVWRNKVLLVADDDRVPRSTAVEYQHVRDSELLARDHIPANLDLEKVYGVMPVYPMDADSHRPDARNAVISAWNEGALLINYIGHGAYWVWGHEWYLLGTDIPGLSNSSKLPLVVMGTCGTSRFDNSRYESIGSALVTTNSGGAIATIGATRGTYSTGNFALATGIMDGIFLLGFDLGQALYSSKLIYTNSLYLLLGDPAQRLATPSQKCVLTISSDTLKNRGLYNVTGTITNPSGLYEGSAEIRLFDVSELDSIDRAPSIKYTVPGKMIIRINAPFKETKFQASFYMPNMSSIRPDSVFVPGLKLNAFVSCGTLEASGAFTDTLWSGGTYIPPSGTVDSLGPEITFLAGNRPMIDGELIASSSNIRVMISDSSGININPSSSLSSDQIRLIVDNKIHHSLNEDFIYQNGGPYSGTAAISLPQLSKGTHEIRVTAYDCYGNKGMAGRKINYIGDGDSRLTEVYNYPNPFKSSTWFTFNLHQEGEVIIRIYTVTGRLIRELTPGNLAIGYNQILWDGLDAEGDRPGNGVYFYKITSTSSNGSAYAIGKLMIVK